MKKILLSVFTLVFAASYAQTQVDLPITFDDANVNYDLVSFGNAADSIITDPTDPNNTVMRQTQPVGPETWAGTTMGNGGLANAIPLATGNLIMSVRVWSPNAGIPVLLKVEDKANGAVFVETQTNTTMASTWETLVFDFGNPGPNTQPFDPNATYDKISIFCDFGNTMKNGEVYYIDDVMMGTPSTGTQVDLPITFDDPMVDYKPVSFGDMMDSIQVDPTDPNNMVMGQTKSAAAQTWAGTTMGGDGLATAIPFDADNNLMSARVWSPDSGTPVLLKVEDKTDGSISVENMQYTTVAGGWSTLVFDFTSNQPGTPAIDYTKTYDLISIFPNFLVAGAGETYYIDDVEFIGSNIGLDEAAWVNNLQVSPNPSNGIVKLAANLTNTTETSITVTDLNGRVIYATSVNGNTLDETIDLSDVANGLYLVAISSKYGTQVEKIVKQ